jgi:hypothetical protein
MFLKQLYNQWRIMFYTVTVFIVAQAFFMYKGIENTPFFLYHMFSTPHSKKDSLPVQLIKTADGYFNQFSVSNREAELLLNNIYVYQYLQQHQLDPILPTVISRFSNYTTKNQLQLITTRLCNDTVAMKQFPIWWKQYFYSITNSSFTPISVVSSYVHFNKMSVTKSNSDSIIFLTLP